MKKKNRSKTQTKKSTRATVKSVTRTTAKRARKTATKSAPKSAQKTERIIVAISGGFDPVHIGHVRMFNEAKALGHKLIVILNNDAWLHKKKGFVFMPEHERKEVIEGFRAVDEVVFTKHGTEHVPDATDMSVCHMLHEIKPHIFANGGDRFADNIPEAVVCRELGIETIFNVGQGGKVQSSSWLVKKLKENKDKK
jgi:cytidyltransferase-like protein